MKALAWSLSCLSAELQHGLAEGDADFEGQRETARSFQRGLKRPLHAKRRQHRADHKFFRPKNQRPKRITA